MQILFLTSRLPYPPYRGDKLKAYNIIKFISQRHDIYLLSLIEKREELNLIQHLKQFCKEIHVVYLSQLQSIAQSVAGLPRSTPFQVAYYQSKIMHQRLRDILRTKSIDIIHTQLIRMAQYTAHIDTYPKVLELTDAISLYLERFLAKEKNILKKAGLFVEYRRMKSYESIIRNFDCALVCSEIDRQVLKKRAPDARVELLYNGVDLETFSEDGVIAVERNSIIYTGNMAYDPNIDGAVYFVRKIFPLIKKQIPEVKLYIVGQDPPRKVQLLANANIVVTGFVPNIRDYYLKSAVAVSPIRFGAGTLNKILEPLALGVPVVSTSIGFEGLQLRDQEHILVADEPEKFAQAVVKILMNHELRRKLSENGKQVVQNLYGWNTVVHQLESVYESVFHSHTMNHVKA